MKAVKTNYQDSAGVTIAHWVVDSFNVNYRATGAMSQVQARIAGYISPEHKANGKAPVSVKSLSIKATDIDTDGNIPQQLLDKFVKEKFLEGCETSIV